MSDDAGRLLLDGLLALAGVLKLLRCDLVQQIAQPLLDDIKGDFLSLGTTAGRPLNNRDCQSMECHDILQHFHRLQEEQNFPQNPGSDYITSFPETAVRQSWRDSIWEETKKRSDPATGKTSLHNARDRLRLSLSQSSSKACYKHVGGNKCG